MKRTSGPWSISKIGNNYEQYAVYAECGELICNSVEGRPNAELIALAPELLEALKRVVAISDRKHEAWDAAKAAIAEAEGSK